MSGPFSHQLVEYQGRVDTGLSTSEEPCLSCQKIADAIFVARIASMPRITSRPRTDLDVGDWQGFLDRRKCACCQKIVQYFQEPRPWTVMFEPSCPLKFVDMRDCFWLTANSSLDPHSTGHSKFRDHPVLRIIPIEIRGNRLSRYIPVDQAHIDVARLGAWAAYCNRSHRGICHDLPHWQIIPPPSSLIFVDVQECCLVQILERVSQRYVTLSYVWGQSPGTMELKRSNLSQLCIKDSLKFSIQSSRMPRTILDAISLTRAMGLRYLWVDRLCIIQDEPTHLTQQLRQMAQIYANSYFTIIAADGSNADYGLRGVDPSLSPRSYVDEQFEPSTDVKMIKMPEKESIWRKPAWHTRAWTFQERAISRRTLVFTNDTVYWQCRSATWFENFAAEPDGIPSPQIYPYFSDFGWPSYWLKIRPWPDINYYFNLVSGYSSRNLSFESDALRAFTAITTAMSKSFAGGFYFGIPVFAFDLGMLWSTRAQLKRRNSFPSWSWLGWVGNVELPFGYTCCWRPTFDYSSLVVDIKPLIGWNEKMLSPRVIDNSYSLYKPDSRKSELSLPKGWTRTWNAEHNVEAVYHESLPDQLFRFPFPIFPTITEDITENPSPYLEFDAELCTLVLGASIKSSFESEPLLKVDLLGNDGRWVGVVESLFVHRDQFKYGEPCEFIAISQGRAKRSKASVLNEKPLNPFEEMGRVKDIEDLEEYSFYNVLWIEWVDGVAYRKAIGRVWTQAWNLQTVTVVGVVLG